MDLKKLNQELENSEPGDVLSWAAKEFGDELVLASSFSNEDNVLVAMAKDKGIDLHVVTLDTGRLPEETYIVMDEIHQKYGVKIDTYFPDRQAVEALVRNKGFYSFKASIDNRKECCQIRKVEPLKRALAGQKAWITGQRRDQATTRTQIEKVSFDDANHMHKISPLVDWTEETIKTYVKEHGVPQNKLYEKGYRSIGCAPCSRAVPQGGNERAGRWWWESDDHKECGIHR